MCQQCNNNSLMTLEFEEIASKIRSEEFSSIFHSVIWADPWKLVFEEVSHEPSTGDAIG